MTQEFQRSEVLFRQIFEENKNAMIITDESGDIVMANKEASLQFGYGKVEFKELKIEKLIPDYLQNQIANSNESQRSPKFRSVSKRKELWAKSKSGNKYPIEIKLSPLQYDDVFFSLITVQDISAHKQKEEEIQILKNRESEELRKRINLFQEKKEIGELISGHAHEISNPLSAIKASIENILTIKSYYKSIVNMLNLLTKEHSKLFLHLVGQALECNELISLREERQIRDDYESVLEEMGVHHANDLAEIITDLRLSINVKEYKVLLYHEKNTEIFKAALDITLQHRYKNIIQLSVNNALKVISELKTNTHLNNLESFIDYNIIEGIEDTLTQHLDQLRIEVETVKKYDNLPLIKCIPDLMSKVWDILISNAIYRMSEKGTLTILLQDHPKSVLVVIEDNGKGISVEKTDHIYDKHFTINSGGNESSMNLDIIKKIIDHHGGKISFSSRNGKTNIGIELPK